MEKAIISSLFVSFIILGGMVLFFNYGGVAGNKSITGEIIRLDSISDARSLTAEDLSELKQMVKGDHIAEDYVTNIEWLLQNGDADHVTHSLGYLFNYIMNGKYEPCLVHETEHMILFYEKKDRKMQQHAIDTINDNLAEWQFRMRSLYNNDPAYAEVIDDVSRKMKIVIDNVSKSVVDSDTLNRVEEISRSGLC